MSLIALELFIVCQNAEGTISCRFVAPPGTCVLYRPVSKCVAYQVKILEEVILVVSLTDRVASCPTHPPKGVLW